MMLARPVRSADHIGVPINNSAMTSTQFKLAFRTFRNKTGARS
jgi:hypothetical protein